jgi:hypothetical protein
MAEVAKEPSTSNLANNEDLPSKNSKQKHH